MVNVGISTRVPAFVSVVIVLFAAAACSGEGASGSAQATPTDGNLNEPTASAAGSEPATESVELPADLPVEVPDGGRVDGVFPPAAGTLQDAWVVRILYAPETADSLVEFYDAWFAEQGMEVQTSRGARSARWDDRTDHPLTSVTVNFEDAFFGGNNRLEIWYEADE